VPEKTEKTGDNAENEPRNKTVKKPKPLSVALDILIGLIALTGIILVVRPIVGHWRQDQASQELLEDFEAGEGTISFDSNDLVVDGEDVESFESYELEETTWVIQPTGTIDLTKPMETAQVTITPTPTPTPTQPPVRIVVKAIGRIQIPKIKVDMPIAEGATVYNLRVAIGHYTPSAPLGSEGRCVLFGHRMYTYGRHFNRLGEMAIGDMIMIDDKENRYTYTVDQIDRILPGELLGKLYEPVEGHRITLVTCDPIRVASHRLLVHGELTHTESKP
jgi:sortase A